MHWPRERYAGEELWAGICSSVRLAGASISGVVASTEEGSTAAAATMAVARGSRAMGFVAADSTVVVGFTVVVDLASIAAEFNDANTSPARPAKSHARSQMSASQR